MKSNNKNLREVTLDGMMTVGKSSNNLRMLDFECCEDVEMETFIGRFKVQGMHDGNLYMEELPKRVRNKPLFRLDNSSLTLGRNGWFYFGLRMPESEVEALPEVLIRESRQMSMKLRKEFLNPKKTC